MSSQCYKTNLFQIHSQPSGTLHLIDASLLTFNSEHFNDDGHRPSWMTNRGTPWAAASPTAGLTSARATSPTVGSPLQPPPPPPPPPHPPPPPLQPNMPPPDQPPGPVPPCPAVPLPLVRLQHRRDQGSGRPLPSTPARRHGPSAGSAPCAAVCQDGHLTPPPTSHVWLSCYANNISPCSLFWPGIKLDVTTHRNKTKGNFFLH